MEELADGFLINGCIYEVWSRHTFRLIYLKAEGDEQGGRLAVGAWP